MSDNNIDPKYGSFRDLRQHNGLSRSHAYELLGLGLIKAKKSGVKVLIDFASVDAYLENQPAPTIAPPRRRRSTTSTATAARGQERPDARAEDLSG